MALGERAKSRPASKTAASRVIGTPAMVKRVGAGEGKQSQRRHVAEGVAPADRAPGSGVGAAEREGVRPPQAERGEGRVGGGAGTRQRRSPALLAEAIGREAHIGKIGEGLEGDDARPDAIAEFAEHLRRAVIGVAR